MKPYPFQVEVLREVHEFGGRSLISCEMGLGKTPISLWYVQRNQDCCLPVVVVCPASIKYMWEHEIRRVLGWRASVLEGQTPSNPTRGRHRSVVGNYDILRFWVGWRKKMKPRCVIIDESQYVQNSLAKRTKAVQTLCRSIPHVLALSGTPLMNRPMEMYTTLHLLRPDVFKSRWSFGQEFCAPKWTPWGIKYDGASNTKKLHDVCMESCMSRRRKADVLKDLPEKTRQVVPMKLKRPEEYQRASDDFLNWLREQDPAAAHRAKGAMALTRIGGLLRLAARLKLRSVVDWVNNFMIESNEKLLLFAVHRKMIGALQRRCNAKSLVIDGSVTGRSRKMVVDRFQRDDDVRLLIGNIKAAGVGITLTAASNVAFAELTFRPGDHIQAEDRCHRIGQHDPVWVHYLVAKGTIEVKLCEVIQTKQKVLSAVLDGGEMPDDLDVFSQLLKHMEKGGLT